MTYFIYAIFLIITYHDRYGGRCPAEGTILEKTMTRFLRVRNGMITPSALVLLTALGDVLPGQVLAPLINFSAHAQTNTWINSPFASQSGNFSVTFNATPNANDADIVIGLSQAPASAYTNLAAIVRFNNTGSIDVRNGGAYSSAVTVAYSAGTTYSFRMVVSIPSHTYSVYVTPPGMSAILLASNYAFRTEQASVASLANVGELGTAGTASITNFLVTPSNITACAQGSAYADGCSGAAAGSPQLPTILQGYATRPPWNVAGVDYPVGVPAGISLKDPTKAALPTGCLFSGSTVTCSGGTPITLSGYDFSLHNGTSLTISAANITVQNSKFVVGTNQGSLGRIVNVTGSANNVTFLYNEFDGASIPVTAQAGQTINIANVGTITFKYNYLHNSGGDMIDMGGGPQVNVFQYNMWKDIGVNTAHADTLQWYNSKISAGSDIGFNIVYQSVNQPGPGNGLLVPLSEGPTATMTGMMVNNNTLISLAACSTCNWGMGFYADLGGVADHVAIYNNYIDPTGINLYTASPWLPTGYYGTSLAHPMAMFGLTNMVTGASIPVPSASHRTSQGYYVYPDASGYSPALSDIYTIQASPSSGTVSAGGTITFTLNMDEPWTVTGTPTFSLSSGGAATYSGGSGTNTLTFKYTVRVGDSATNLAITAVNLNGATIKDAVGNSSNLAGAVMTFKGLNVLGAASALTVPR